MAELLLRAAALGGESRGSAASDAVSAWIRSSTARGGLSWSSAVAADPHRPRSQLSPWLRCNPAERPRGDPATRRAHQSISRKSGHRFSARKCDKTTTLERVPGLDLVESCSTFSERALGRTGGSLAPRTPKLGGSQAPARRDLTSLLAAPKKFARCAPSAGTNSPSRGLMVCDRMRGSIAWRRLEC